VPPLLGKEGSVQSSCPTIYTTNTTAGKTLATQCQASVTAGKYIATTNAGTLTDCPSGSYCAGATINYGATGGSTLCSTLGGGLYSQSATGSDAASDCYAEVAGGKYISAKTAGSLTNCEAGYKCPAGNVFWDSIGNRAACSGANEYQDQTSQTTCKSVTGGYYKVSNTELQNCGAGYWCANGTRTACATGQTTVGYGHGADEANDCGRILHIGNYSVYARQNKVTTPSINIKMPNDEMFYISLSPTNHSVSRLHLAYGGNQYTVYDDSLEYGERNFDTNAQIQ